MSLLSVKNLRTWFHTRDGIIKAVDDVSFEVAAGQTLGIVGESGSGKSVCCYSLVGLIPKPPGRIESGQAIFDGIDLLTTSEKQLRTIRGDRIAMIFQDPMTSLNPYMRIGDQLAEPLQMHRSISGSQAKDKVIQSLEEVGIPNPAKKLNDFPHQFSGGMRQRVMIAMALITEPELLIADEPTTALDVTIQAQILDLIQSLRKSHNLSVIFITHDLGVVAGIADQIMVMEKGKAVEYKDTESIFYSHQHPYTAKLLSSIPTGAKPVPTNILEDSDNNTLELKNVSTFFTTYKGVFKKSIASQTKAVDNVSLNLRQGEILGLVGESGSGKSTLGRSIIRLLEINNGTITYNGLSLHTLSQSELKQERKKFQIIFQDPYASLDPRMTVFNILAEPLLLHSICTRKELLKNIHELMDDVGLERKYIRKYPHEFSGGQRQRIAIARAIAVNPEFIIADEPVSALDVTIQSQILNLLLELTQQRNLSMLFISHDLSVVRYICDRVAVMYRGKIVELNQTETLFSKPEHPYTQSLLSAIPIPDPKKEKSRQRIPFGSA